MSPRREPQRPAHTIRDAESRTLSNRRALAAALRAIRAAYCEQRWARARKPRSEQPLRVCAQIHLAHNRGLARRYLLPRMKQHCSLHLLPPRAARFRRTGGPLGKANRKRQELRNLAAQGNSGEEPDQEPSCTSVAGGRCGALKYAPNTGTILYFGAGFYSLTCP